MSSSLLSAIVTLLLVTLLPYSTANVLYDTDGNALINGGSYYIVGAIYSKGKGLTYTQKNNECPLYITDGNFENRPGTPVTISSPYKIYTLSEDFPLAISFSGSSENTPCNESSLGWKRSKNDYITTGATEKAMYDQPFIIKKMGFGPFALYAIKSCDPINIPRGCSDIGFKDDDVLGITNFPIGVQFLKADHSIQKSST